MSNDDQQYLFHLEGAVKTLTEARDACQQENARLVAAKQAAEAEAARLKAGKFTAAEIHDICHNLHGIVDRAAFAAACVAEQRKLYGDDPYARLSVLLRELKAIADAIPPPVQRYVDAGAVSIMTALERMERA